MFIPERRNKACVQKHREAMCPSRVGLWGDHAENIGEHTVIFALQNDP